MNQLFWDSISQHSPLSDEEKESLTKWKNSEVGESVDLIEFLVSRGLLTAGVHRSAMMVKKGFLSREAILHHFDSELVTKLRKELQTRSVASRVTESAPLSGNDVRETLQTPPLPIMRPGFLDSLQPSEESVAWMRPARSESARKTIDPSESLIDYHAPRGSEPLPPPTEITAIPHRNTTPSRLTAKKGDIRPGMKLGKCILTEMVGKGGAGIVFRGIHETLNITVAVKIIRQRSSAHTNSDEALAQMRSEAQILAQMNHPHVIRIFDFELEPEPFLVLEYVEGLSLAELIEHAGCIRYDRALGIIRQAALALQVANQAGILHRDVKPANILIGRSGVTKLADLGLAVVRQGGQGSVHGETPVGTLAYMPPEQALNSKADFRSDIYSLGATFYHAVTGQTPFLCTNFGEAVMNVVREKPRDPLELVPGLDPRASEVIMRMIAKEPMDRFDSYRKLIDELDDLASRERRKELAVIARVSSMKSSTPTVVPNP